jgi:hypothetical protein
MKINYHNRKFRTAQNSSQGQVNQATVFHYSQLGQRLEGTYEGGPILKGQLLGKVNEDNSLDFVYHHVDTDGKLHAGFCHSTPEILSDGRIRLSETWQWTHETNEKGESVVEEII